MILLLHPQLHLPSPPFAVHETHKPGRRSGALLLALAAATIELLLAAPAHAQHSGGGLITCVTASAPTLVRAEGIAELQGDVVLRCSTTASSGLPATLLTNFNITLNTNVTNRLNFGQGATITDAVMLVNENTSGAPTATPSPVGSGQLPQYANRTGDNGLAWNGVNVPVPGVAGNPSVTTLRFTNIRANVCKLGVPNGASFPSTQVTAFVSSTGPTNLSVTNNVLNIGTPMLGLEPVGFSPVTVIQCVGQNLDSSGNLLAAALDDHGNANASFYVSLTEGFATAFKTLGAPTAFPGNTQVEDGFPTPGSGTNNGGSDEGTRFIIRFFNVPSGIRLFTPLSITGTTSTIGGVPHALRIVRLAGAAADGSGAFSTSVSSKEVTIVNGFGFVVYEVVDDNPFVIESVSVPVVVGFNADTANDRPAIGTMQASVSLAPLGTIATSDMTAPDPRFCESSSFGSALSTARCITTLLFPFVTNRAGFDTGLAIANTSADDKGTMNQAGPCTLFYFGDTSGGGATPGSQATAAVQAGGTLTWTLAGGNAASNIPGTPGFQGYIFAECQFQFAHGFAFITDGFGSVPTLAEGYLALIVPNSRSTDGGESLSH